MKLQPNFSWQKYENSKQDSKDQFQYQLQREHILVANSINATIDDESFFTTPRMTSFVWVNGQPIWTVTVPTSAWGPGGTSNVIPLPITGNFTVIDMVCCISNGTLASSDTLLMPHLDPTYGTGSVSIVRNGTNIVLSTSGLDRSAFSGYVTVYYVQS